jgi:hypothetical protein
MMPLCHVRNLKLRPRAPVARAICGPLIGQRLFAFHGTRSTSEATWNDNSHVDASGFLAGHDSSRKVALQSPIPEFWKPCFSPDRFSFQSGPASAVGTDLPRGRCGIGKRPIRATQGPIPRLAAESSFHRASRLRQKRNVFLQNCNHESRGKAVQALQFEPYTAEVSLCGTRFPKRSRWPVHVRFGKLPRKTPHLTKESSYGESPDYRW